MFSTVLIANRGEIACRIARTVRALGIRPVTIYSEADADAPHVQACDDALCIGPPPVAESYLRAEAIIAAAKTLGAEAVHPGYGLLSENARFARSCADAGLVFIGPGAELIEVMGDKVEARSRMAAAGVPVVPGSEGPVADLSSALAVAAEIGYPLLVKAAGGGGGIGMKVVSKEKRLEKALRSCADRGKSSFGNAEIYIERFVEQARHVEVQVLFDNDGHGVHLFERECSLQRRHQKIIEEAPAPIVSQIGPELREQMGAAALNAARTVGYTNAGTVEFVVDAKGSFYFIEMNTRLQVEHPVTEAVVGEDLVAWQLRIAAGEPCTLQQDGLELEGAAIECRLYAEDPRRNFLPSPGQLEQLVLPTGEGLRCDFGYRAGQAVTPYYDPLLGKLIAHGSNRNAALARMRSALDELQIEGIATNAALLRALLDDTDVVAGHFDTSFVEARTQQLLSK